MSDGFYDVFKSAFASVIDFSKENRHFVFLLNIDGRLISYIKLFNLYSIAVEMSEKSYPDAGLGLVLKVSTQHWTKRTLSSTHPVALSAF